MRKQAEGCQPPGGHPPRPEPCPPRSSLPRNLTSRESGRGARGESLGFEKRVGSGQWWELFLGGRSLGRWAVKASWKAERKEKALLEGRTGGPSQDARTESLPQAGSWHKHLSMENQPCPVPASPGQHYSRLPPPHASSSLLYLHDPRPSLKVTSSMEPSGIEPCWSMWHFLLTCAFASPSPAPGPLCAHSVPSTSTQPAA